nr:chanoclavine-i aldehyde reductase easa [Quercus suber]
MQGLSDPLAHSAGLQTNIGHNRFRATDDYVPGPYVKEYYEQRASCAGTLIITEATFISPQAGGYKNVPGIWNGEQIAAWKEVVRAVHQKGSVIYLQLWALGRVTGAVPKIIEGQGYDVVSASDVPVDDKHQAPRALSEAEVQAYIQAYATATKNALEAGFDGVEIHGANGYLIDQFWQSASNRRTDRYGGSIENRARFGLEVTKACIEAAAGDSNKVAMRLSPWSSGQGMGMKREDALAQFSYVVRELKQLKIAYLHLVEARVGGSSAVDAVYQDLTRENDPLVQQWGSDSPVILAGGYDVAKAKRVTGEIYTAGNVAIAFGRYFISTPDLPFRAQAGLELNPYDRETFYKGGAKGRRVRTSQDGIAYTDMESSFDIEDTALSTDAAVLLDGYYSKISPDSLNCARKIAHVDDYVVVAVNIKSDMGEHLFEPRF